jgi:hypothetical protein
MVEICGFEPQTPCLQSRKSYLLPIFIIIHKPLYIKALWLFLVLLNFGNYSVILSKLRQQCGNENQSKYYSKKMNKEKGDIVLYTTEDNKIKIELKVFDETVWLTQKEISELFQTTTQNITQHIKDIYETFELEEISTCKNYLQVQKEGNREVSRDAKFYNLDVILAIGYRVRSHRGTQFRKWATTTLKEYLIKGFIMNDERLKNPKAGDYFDELLERIREIRASEKRVYQKIRDIYKLSVDYDKDLTKTIEFFKKVQNKTIYAITGQTAAEIIKERANHSKPNMGLTSWRGSKVRKLDVAIAKNYLEEPEIEDLNRIIVMYLDHAEDMAKRQKVIYMKDWEEKLDEFLKFTKREILQNAGKVSADIAQKLAESEYEEFTKLRLKIAKEKSDEEILKEIEVIEQNLTKKDE